MVQKIPVPLKDQSEQKMRKFLKDRICALREGWREIHETRLPNWRRIYEAQPLEAVREFPFHNASNLVVPVVAIHSDTLLARVMSATLKTRPLWTVRVLTDMRALAEIGELRGLLEEFGEYVGLEPEQLDLMRVYQEWFGETIRYGTSVVKSPIERDMIDTVIPAGDGTGTFEYMPEIEYEGPRPFKIPFHDFFVDPSAPTLESADLKAHRIRLRRHQIEERAFRKIYEPSKAAIVLKQPDRTAPDVVQTGKEQDAGVRTMQGFGWAEWDIYECWFRYRLNNKYVRILAWYHEKSDTILRAYFNYYPDEPFVGARLFYRDDMWPGYGFCETLGMLQEEISTIHNQRRDNMTVANTRVWRVSVDSKLNKGYRIYPSAMLPGEKDEIEPMAHGELSPIAIEEEQLSLELAEKRSGVSSPMQGSGAGSNNKRGVYTAMGTLSLLQEGNTRTDLNTTDIRYAHTRLGRLLFRQYAHFGVGNDLKRMFGERGRLLQKALDEFQAKNLALPISAATASVNREVEKQNDLMLTNVLNKHYQMVSQMLGTSGNPMVPEPTKKYIGEAVQAANALMRQVMRHFGYDEVERLVPDVPAPPPEQGQPQGQGGQPNMDLMRQLQGMQGGGPGSVLPMAGGGQPQ